MEYYSRSLDQWGRPTTIHFGTNTVTLKYRADSAPYVLSETLNGVTVTNAYDSLLRRITNGVVVTGSWLITVTNHYDGASRLRVVSDGTHSATYSYLANSPLVSQILFKQGSSDRMTTTKTYDYLNRLKKIESVAGGSTVSSHAYAYNPANQRTSATNAENARWIYDYDNLGQVISGKKYWNDGTPVAGQQFEYSFDDIGNRKSSASGGNEWGSGLRYANYTANNLNQYTSRTVPSYVDVLGSANSNATVTVNNTATHRKGEYFRAEVQVSNASGAVYLTLTNLAVLNDGSNPDITTNAVGALTVASATETIGYDADGNLTNDSRWVCVWDAENRLISMTSSNIADNIAKKKLEFDYDWFSRRIAKRVYDWNGSSWQLAHNHRFGYDGWNVIVDVNTTNNTALRKYLWGLDLSGSLRGAGGVGGLLAINDTVEGTHFAAYDANGNLTALTSVTNSEVSARYEYSPFGDLLRENGRMSKLNDFTFSTKRLDRDTQCYYYGYRYLRLGGWLSRDPIGERGGLNLVGFVRNSPIDFVDKLGLYNPITGPEGSVGSGTGLADPILYWPPQLRPPGPPIPPNPPSSPPASPGGPEFGGGLGASFSGMAGVLGGEFSIGCQATTCARICFTVSGTVIIGAGGGGSVSLDVPLTYSRNGLDGENVSLGVGAAGVLGLGGGGSFDLDFPPDCSWPPEGGTLTFGLKGGEFAGGGIRGSVSCTGCASVLRYGPLATVVAARNTQRCIFNRIRKIIEGLR